jgi:hypothetical protein
VPGAIRILERLLLGEVVDDQGAAGAQLLPEPPLDALSGEFSRRMTDAVLDEVEDAYRHAVGVAQPDPQVLAAEHAAQLIAHGVDHRLELDTRADRALDGVDHRQLGVALLGSPSEGAASRRTGARSRARFRGSRRSPQRAQVGIVEGVLALVVLDDDHAEHAAAAADRCARDGIGSGRCPEPRPMPAARCSSTVPTNPPTPSRTIRFAGLFCGRILYGPRDGTRRPCSIV